MVIMSNSELFQAFQMFQQGVQQAATSAAVNDATQAMNEINTNITDEAQKRQALQQLSNQVALRLTGVGAPASAVQQAFNAVAPQQFGDVNQLEVEAALSGNQAYSKAAVGIRSKQAAAEQAKLLTQHQLKMAEMQAQLGADLTKEQFKSNAAAKELKSDEIKEISEARSAMEAVDSVSKLFNELRSTNTLPTTGPGVAGSGLLKAANPKRAEFQMMQEQYFNQYRKAITGAGASEAELEKLREALPSMGDLPHVFQQKLTAMRVLAKDVRDRKIQEYRAAGRSTEGIEQITEAEEQARAQGMEKANRVKSYFVGR